MSVQLTCQHCGYITSSLLPGEEAIAECSVSFSSHLRDTHANIHAEMFQELTKLNSLAAWIVMIAKHTTLLDKPVSETINDIISIHFSDVVDELEECLGVEINDESESDDVPEELGLHLAKRTTKALPSGPGDVPNLGLSIPIPSDGPK